MCPMKVSSESNMILGRKIDAVALRTCTSSNDSMLHLIAFAAAASMTVQMRKAAYCFVFAKALRTQPLSAL